MLLFDTNINFSDLKVPNGKVLRVILSLFLSLFGFLGLPSIAGEKISQSLMTEETSKVKICNDRGSIRVNTWDKNEVLVKGQIDDLADHFIFDKKDDLILIEVKLSAKHAHGKNNGKGSELEVWLPKKHDLQYNGIATDLSLNGLGGEVNINSVSGAINAESISGNLRIRNISGKIQLNDVSSQIDISTVSGDLNAKVTSSLIKVKAISSDIFVVTKQIENINLFSISGSTKLSGELNKHGEIKLENISGESFFFFKEPINAKVSIETGPDGSIINRVKPFEKKNSHLNSQQQAFIEGIGNAKITLRTVSGKVGLKGYKEMNKR